MLRSNVHALIVSVLATAVLAGCTKPGKATPPDGTDVSTANFRVKSGAVSGNPDPILGGDVWGKPFSVSVNFKACLEDRASDRALLGKTFKVIDPATKQEMSDVPATNAEGCMAWSETLPFNYFAKRSRWVTIERDIVGSGVAEGRRRVVYAVNPWMIADRVEIKAGKAGYFLRDDPMDVKNTEARFQKVYEFFSDLVGADAQATSDQKKSAIDVLKGIFTADRGTDERLLAPPEVTKQVLGGTQPEIAPMGMTLASNWGNAGIWVDNVRVMNLKKRAISQTQDSESNTIGYVIQQTIQMVPRLIVRKANGQVDFEDIKQGEFDVFVQVVATDFGFEAEDKKMAISTNLTQKSAALPVTDAGAMMSKGPSGTGRIIDGKLYAAVNFSVDATAAEGNVDFIVRLVPRGIGNRAPAEFNGIFNMGKIGSWIGGMPPTMIDASCIGGEGKDFGCNLEQYFKGLSTFKDLKASGDAYALDRYLFTNVRPRFVQVMAGGVKAIEGTNDLDINVAETATRRTVYYAASTCVSAQSGEKIPGQKFILEITSAEPGPKNDNATVLRTKTQEVFADAASCLNWTNTITHYYYRPEQFFQQTIKIKGPAGYERIKKVYLNPWDDKFTFGFDEEELGKKFFAEIAKRPKIPSRFYTGDYSYHTVRFLYEIDPYMDLEVKKTVLMDLQPRVLRYSGILSGRKVTESLRDGIYLLKVGIQKSYLDPSDRFHKLCDVTRARAERDADGRVKEVWERATVDDPSLCNLSETERDKVRVSLADQAETDEAHNNLEAAQNNVVTKEFVTAKSILVRVTDGLIIHPVELSMKDLRLMRIRSNFLVQLETVDESTVVAHTEIKSEYKKYITDSLAQYRADREAERASTVNQESDEAIDDDRADLDALVGARARAKRSNLEILWRREVERLSSGGTIISDFAVNMGELQSMIDGFDNDMQFPEMQRLYPKLTIDRFNQLRERYQFYKKVARNDFTEVGLPDCDRVNCNDFRDMESGLKSRTFVGPVIFLSNSYKDAVRATDNLDEARCHEEIPGVDVTLAKLDPTERRLLDYETSLLTNESESLLGLRSNNAYRYNKYFNSLRQFCTRDKVDAAGNKTGIEFYPMQVDDLIDQGKVLQKDYANKMKALATPYNFVSVYDLDFVSFGGEKLKKLNDRLTDDCLKNDVTACMSTTDERTLSADTLVKMANVDLDKRINNVFRWPIIDAPLNRAPKTAEDIKAALFSPGKNIDTSATICSMLASAAAERVHQLKPQFSAKQAAYFGQLAFGSCMGQQGGGYQRERKLRIYDTGEYVFKGGLQLNFNVTASFGIGRSASTSAGMDYLDMGAAAVGGAGLIFGGPMAALAGFGAVKAAITLLKPFDLKQSVSQNESTGTNISEGTYLVSQVAKFQIPLKSWEECSVVRFRPEAVKGVIDQLGWIGTNFPQEDLDLRYEMIGMPGKMTDLQKSVFSLSMSRGFFICSGVPRNDVRNVEELYFYFTQHFTEGDMLDQADLYNHPWLLSLRGLRDFSAFVAMIRGQEVGDIRQFVDDVSKTVAPFMFGEKETHESDKAGWAWDHMQNTYKATLPSFPGLYTVLEEGEGMNFFTLDDRPFSKVDLDINAEVSRASEALSPSRVQQ